VTKIGGFWQLMSFDWRSISGRIYSGFIYFILPGNTKFIAPMAQGLVVEGECYDHKTLRIVQAIIFYPNSDCHTGVEPGWSGNCRVVSDL
jgi:hypothetical protein